MKKLALLLFSFMALTSFADVGPVGRSASLDGAGNIQAGSVEKWFINVKNVSGGALVDGDVVVPDTTEDDGYSVNTSSTAGAVPLCVLDEACADDAMCRCQTWGLKTNVNFDATNETASAGAQVFISENNAGYVQAELVGSYAAGDIAIGVFYDDVTASGDAEVFLKLR